MQLRGGCLILPSPSAQWVLQSLRVVDWRQGCGDDLVEGVQVEGLQSLVFFEFKKLGKRMIQWVLNEAIALKLSKV